MLVRVAASALDECIHDIKTDGRCNLKYNYERW